MTNSDEVIDENGHTDIDEDDDAARQQITEIISFLRYLDDTPSNKDENTKRLNELLQDLPPNGINVHTDDFLRQTILHVAVLEGLEWAVKALLDKEVDVNATEYEGWSPLH
ncbi:uncharacterized protein F4822DRAFT_427926 [Hypoxylon trugodes]|uniref:uncharacterized protein n=1 Tax=Hypoxylon trugodes TaxID=326681 RepID=UPI0021A0D9BD|nr:uncharacterized protein F4822DRAFT_427926 [Hypoxylon trugodes]KAI1389581.1 hypothetical protein F4822DRAFT_427926 [Hypoxylon trugodes]